jgi:hypothetical protein
MLYERYNPAYKAVFGRDMPRTDKYTPLIRDKEFVGDNIEDFFNTKSFISTANTSAVYKRTRSTEPYKKIDGDRILLNHIDRMEYFRAKAGALKEMNKYLGPHAKEIRQAILQKGGKRYIDVLDSFLSDFGTNSTRPSTRASRNIDKARGLFTTASLAARPVQLIKQASAIPAYSSLLPPGVWLKGMGDFFKNPVNS